MPFWHPISIKFSCFTRMPSRWHFWRSEAPIYAQNDDFGTILDPPGTPNPTSGPPYFRKISSKTRPGILRGPPGTPWVRLWGATLIFDPPRRFPDGIFADFVCILGGFGFHFGMIYVAKSASFYIAIFIRKSLACQNRGCARGVPL